MDDEMRPANAAKRHVLIVDLNNFARYPTIPVGYLAAVCRGSGMSVSVLSPLTLGLSGVVRERRVPWHGFAVEALNYRAATSRSRFVRKFRDWLAARQSSRLQSGIKLVTVAFKEALRKERPDAVLISTYLMYRDHVAALCALCKELNIPAVIGGPYFAQPEVAAQWINIDGATAIVGGEIEQELPKLLDNIWRKAPNEQPGVWIAGSDGGLVGRKRPPLIELDQVPLPDYSDFTWDLYPNRIIPIITGRGCGWGACRFCSDITSTAGRTYRSRTAANVIEEIRKNYQAHGAKLFAFTDLKLNSDLTVWRTILERMQEIAPGSEWIGAVHVDARSRPENGLSSEELRQAARSGCVRLTTGLESGSQHVLDLMKKGALVETTGEFLMNASAAGISTRCTMIVGYPGEQADDVRKTARFLAAHRRFIDRVSLNRFSLVTGTSIHRILEKRPSAFQSVSQIDANHSMASVSHRYQPENRRAHTRAVDRLLWEVHHINRKALKFRATAFDGVM